jgi:hypothetical protein
LTEYEAKAYVSLLNDHMNSAAKLSKKSGVPRTKIYETLESLQAKGWVQIYSGVPLLFRAADSGLSADGGSLAFVPSPAFDRVPAAVRHVERAADVPLRRFGEAGELFHFREQQRAVSRLAGPRNHHPDSLVPPAG